MPPTKLWLRKYEWLSYSACGDSIDHILPAKRRGKGPVSDVRRISDICGSCRVRPECIMHAVDTKAHSVWVAGQWIPDDDGNRAGKVWRNKRWVDSVATRVRKSLQDTVDRELEMRGDDV